MLTLFTAVLLWLSAILVLDLGVDGLIHRIDEEYPSPLRVNPVTGIEERVWMRYGVELLIVPVAALAAACFGSARAKIARLQSSAVRSFLPTMAIGALILIFWGHILQSWQTYEIGWGPVPEFAVARWFGALLVGAFAFVLAALFPRVAGILAGMIGGPALFAVIGYGLFPSFMSPVATMASDMASTGEFPVVSVATLVPVLSWIVLWVFREPKSWRWWLLGRGEEPSRASLLTYAFWSGAVLFGLALWGTSNAA